MYSECTVIAVLFLRFHLVPVTPHPRAQITTSIRLMMLCPLQPLSFKPKADW